MSKGKNGWNGSEPENGRIEQPAKRGRRPGPAGPTVEGGSRDARRVAAVILEVLAGQRTPTDAAALLSISLTRYYALESRALEGLVAACEPRGPGRRSSPARENTKLRAEIEHLERRCARTQALLRLSQRAIGVVPSPAPKENGNKGKRKRRPVARALQAAAKLQAESPRAKETGDAMAR